MTRLFRNESSDPKTNAQRNLMGRTHYVDDDTLRFHKSRIISARNTDGGMLFAIVTSDAQNYENTRRGFRYVIFDVFGAVVERNPNSLDATFYRTSAQATKAMWAALNALDAKAITLKAVANARRNYEREMDELVEKVQAIETVPAAA